MGDLGGGDGQLVELYALLVGFLRQVGNPPGAGLAGGGARRNGGDDGFEGAGVDNVPHFGVGESPFLLNASLPHPGQFREGGPDFFHPFLRRDDWGQVGVVEVAVVLGGFLGPALGGGPVGLLVVAGFLDDGAAVCEDLGLPLHFVADRLVDGAQGVNVFRFGAGAELGGADGFEGHVGVDAHGSLVHAGVGNPEGLDQVAEGGNVGAGTLGGAMAGADDGFRDDFDEGNTGPVAVNEGGGGAVDAAVGATNVGELTGVFLHVGALDFDAPFGAIVENNVKVAVVGYGLVVLGDLVVFGLVGVEIVFAGESG